MNMDYTLMLCGKDAFSYFFFVDLPPPAAQLGQMAKNPPKNQMRKFVKLTGHSYTWNSLTNFQHEAMTGNGNQVNLLKTCLKKTREIISSLQ